MKQQYTLMRFDPQHGTDSPYPSHAEQYRQYHGQTAWLINPWSGARRDPRDIGTDIQGLLILPDEEPTKACQDIKEQNKATDPDFIFDVLGEIIDRIERCGASTELTNAVSLACAFRYAVGNKWNQANAYALDRVNAAMMTRL